MDEPLGLQKEYSACRDDSSSVRDEAGVSNLQDEQQQLQQCEEESESGAKNVNATCGNFKKAKLQRQQLHSAGDGPELKHLDIVMTSEMDEPITSRMWVNSGDASSSIRTLERDSGDAKKKGAVECTVVEQDALEEVLQEKDAQEQSLVKELENTLVRLQHLRQDRVVLQQQKAALSTGHRCTKKVVLHAEVENGAEEPGSEEHLDLEVRLLMLELALEKQQNYKHQQEQQQHQVQTETLQQRIHNLEQQLLRQWQLINERNPQRDTFQWTIKNLEAELRLPPEIQLGVEDGGQKITEEKLVQTDFPARSSPGEQEVPSPDVEGTKKEEEEEDVEDQPPNTKLQEMLKLTKSSLNPKQPDVSEESLDPNDSLDIQAPQSPSSFIDKVCAELERLVEEKDALQQLLFFQQRQHGQQVALLSRSLAQAEGDLARLRVRLGREEAEIQQQRARIRRLQAGQEHLGLQLRRAGEETQAAQTQLSRLGAEVRIHRCLDQQKLEILVRALDEKICRSRGFVADPTVGKKKKEKGEERGERHERQQEELEEKQHEENVQQQDEEERDEEKEEARKTVQISHWTVVGTEVRNQLRNLQGILEKKDKKPAKRHSDLAHRSDSKCSEFNMQWSNWVEDSHLWEQSGPKFAMSEQDPEPVPTEQKKNDNDEDDNENKPSGSHPSGMRTPPKNLWSSVDPENLLVMLGPEELQELDNMNFLTPVFSDYAGHGRNVKDLPDQELNNEDNERDRFKFRPNSDNTVSADW